jgi:hypothetical protein
MVDATIADRDGVMKLDDMGVAESTTLGINTDLNELRSGLGGFQHPGPC